MGIPALSMFADLTSDLAAGKIPANLASSVAGANASQNLAGSLASGLSHMSGVALIGGILFSGIGTVVMVYGKKKMNVKTILIGALLFGYPFLVYTTAMTYGIGIGLCLLLFLTREKENSYTR